MRLKKDQYVCSGFESRVNSNWGKLMSQKKEVLTTDVLKLERNLTDGRDPYTDVSFQYAPRDAIIRDDKGKIVDHIKGSIFPAIWEEQASNTVTTKYFRRTDVPQTGREIDIRQLAGRVARTIAKWGLIQGYFDEEMEKVIEDEIVASTVLQYGAFNSPVWFNLGLHEYGLKKAEKTYYTDIDGVTKEAANVYEHPQVSACFISSPDDSIESMINVASVVSSVIFKRGSGVGGDWSKVRSAGEVV